MPLQSATALAVGTVLSSTGILVAAADDPGAGLAPYVGGGAGVVAVAMLAEVTRRLLSGRLIPRETRDLEQELAAAITVSGQREALSMQHAEEARHAATNAAKAAREAADVSRDILIALDRLTRTIEDR